MNTNLHRLQTIQATLTVGVVALIATVYIFIRINEPTDKKATLLTNAPSCPLETTDSKNQIQKDETYDEDIYFVSCGGFF